MWVRIKELASDLWVNEAGKCLQPQFRKVIKGQRIFKDRIEGFPPLVGELAKVCKKFPDGDGEVFAIQTRQELMQTCPQDYWLCRPSDVEEVVPTDEDLLPLMVSWMRTVQP